MLTTGRELVHYHTGTMTRQSPGLNALVPDGRLELNPDDAKRLGIQHGERIKVSSRRGAIEPVAWVTDRVSPGLVFMPFHYVEAPANRLTSSHSLDPIARIPEFKVSAVKVEAPAVDPTGTRSWPTWEPSSPSRRRDDARRQAAPSR